MRLTSANPGALALSQSSEAPDCAHTLKGAEFLQELPQPNPAARHDLYDAPAGSTAPSSCRPARLLLTNRDLGLSDRAKLDCEPTRTLKGWVEGVEFIFGTQANQSRRASDGISSGRFWKGSRRFTVFDLRAFSSGKTPPRICLCRRWCFDQAGKYCSSRPRHCQFAGLSLSAGREL